MSSGAVLRNGSSVSILAYEPLPENLKEAGEPCVTKSRDRAGDNPSFSGSRLLDLPEKILDRIAQFIRSRAVDEAKTIQRDKVQYLGRADPESDDDYEARAAEGRGIILLKDRLVFLNGFQSLGCLNRMLHRICCPWLCRVWNFCDIYE